MRKRKWLILILVALVIPVSIMAALMTAGAAPAQDSAALSVGFTGTIELGNAGAIDYTITVTNNSSSDVGNIYVTGTIPDGTKLDSALATPKGAGFLGQQGDLAAWVSQSIPAGDKQTFTYKVTVTKTPPGAAHAWIHWTQPSDGTAASDDVTWNAAVAAGAPRRGCLACHVLVDPAKGSYTLAFEAHERVEVDYPGREHPTVAPDGTSIKPTDQTGPGPCLQCHKPGTGDRAGKGAAAPLALRDIVHPAHLFSKAFQEHYNGTCFTCHNVRGDGSFELLGDKVDTNEKGVPTTLLQGTGSIPGEIAPSEGSGR